ncbi:MAG TPA: glycosyltransferase family 4 protein [Candidatus Acidoferrum sp.]|nr:glycosyltransferase family 4 protein [Candidatus Acidoferrum sp.]
MPIRLATIVSHPIQYFAPWHRELAKVPEIDSKIFFCCDWGMSNDIDPGFNREVTWDIPLLDGYAHEFLPIARRPQRMSFWEMDNPTVTAALDRFQPDVVTVYGYAYRTNWRAALWSHRNRRPLLLFSDSNLRLAPAWWKRAIKDIIVRRFYRYVDGALCVGENNSLYHAYYGIPPDRLFPGVYPIERRRLLQAVPDRAATRSAIRHALGIPQDAFIVLFCGKYIDKKRPQDLIVAAHSLARKGLPVWALLVGEGEERPALEAFCERERVNNAVLTGFVNQSAIASYYAASDVIAVTSSFEAYGLVASEASVFGLPILASDRVGCIGPQDTAQPGRNAIVFPCGDTQRLSDAIELLYNDRSLYAAMSSNSTQISESQDELVATERMSSAVRRLHEMGPRWLTSGSRRQLKSEAAPL